MLNPDYFESYVDPDQLASKKATLTRIQTDFHYGWKYMLINGVLQLNP